MTDKLRIQHIRDPKNAKRVLTIASLFNPETRLVRYAYSLCAPTTVKNDKGQTVRAQGDVFKKTEGTLRAKVRLNLFIDSGISLGAAAGTVKVPEGRHPNDALLDVLAETDNRSVVKRTAKAQLTKGQQFQAQKQANIAVPDVLYVAGNLDAYFPN